MDLDILNGADNGNEPGDMPNMAYRVVTGFEP